MPENLTDRDPVCKRASKPEPEPPAVVVEVRSVTLSRDPVSGRFLAGHGVGQQTRVKPGNTLARRVHGVRAFQARGPEALPPEVRQRHEAFRAAVEADRGGPEHLTTLDLGYIRHLADIEAVIALFKIDLEAHGIFTTRGRVRALYFALLNALDRWDKFAQRIGVGRDARPVDVRTYLQARAEASTSAER
jgi:hypothetical protein